MSDEEAKPRVERTWHELYIQMQSDPMDTRTDRDFFTSIDLPESTFYAWKTKFRSHIFKEVEKRRNEYRNELRSKMYKALSKKLDKDTNAIKLLAQLLGDLVEKTETKMEMSDADKMRRVVSLMGEISKKRQAWDTSEGKPAQEDRHLGDDKSGDSEHTTEPERPAR